MKITSDQFATIAAAIAFLAKNFNEVKEVPFGRLQPYADSLELPLEVIDSWTWGEQTRSLRIGNPTSGLMVEVGKVVIPPITPITPDEPKLRMVG